MFFTWVFGIFPRKIFRYREFCITTSLGICYQRFCIFKVYCHPRDTAAKRLRMRSLRPFPVSSLCCSFSFGVLSNCPGTEFAGMALKSSKTRKIHPRVFPFSKKKTENWSFHVVVLQRTEKKCTRMCNARAESFFCLLKPIVFRRSRCRRRGGCLNSLMPLQWRHANVNYRLS